MARTRKGWARRLAAFGAVAVAVSAGRNYGWDGEAAVAAFRRGRNVLGPWAAPSYVLAHALTLALCPPYAIFFEGTAALVFGFLPGVACVFSAKILGASLSFWIGNPVRPALAPASPAQTGPRTGAIRMQSSKVGALVRLGPGHRPGLDRPARSQVRLDRMVDRPPRRQPAYALVPSGRDPVPKEECTGRDPVPAPVETDRCSVELWEIIVHGYREPHDPVRLTSTEFYNHQLNASARDKIRSGINRKLLDQVNDIDSAKELWDRIVVLQEGTDLIQSALYESAKQEATMFMIREGESVANAYARLGALKVRVKGLGVEKYNDGFEMNEAFIKSKVIAMIAVKQEDTNLATQEC
ncbi:hypothetical protein QYE76_062655 [Lolium multiflorum]|uniref:Uncharacterized protein n=1 Tax=Lolium multiflorum TaxID=4521 RepID=A0AAD8S5M0_LOLMU|nr:hypothetical protein QYE76_062655 [Lolium multiflorum]